MMPNVIHNLTAIKHYPQLRKNLRRLENNKNGLDVKPNPIRYVVLHFPFQWSGMCRDSVDVYHLHLVPYQAFGRSVSYPLWRVCCANKAYTGVSD